MAQFDITKDSLLTADDICQKLSISRSTFDRWRDASNHNSLLNRINDFNSALPKIPFPKPTLDIGRSPRWSASDINKWIKDLGIEGRQWK